MDVLFFLKERIKFIRHFYETAGEPFRETIRKIEAGEDPFEPPYSENGEPPFMEEWHDAHIALEMLGRTCVSILSESLKLYFKTWAAELGLSCEKKHKNAFKNGFIHGYRACFGQALKLTWGECPADLALLEQITLVRNRSQHPDSITTLDVTHSKCDQNKHSNLFFVNEVEKDIYSNTGNPGRWLMDPTVHVSREKLFAAIEEVEAFVEWLEEQVSA